MLSEHLDEYREFLARKVVEARPKGMDAVPELPAALRADQRAVTGFALRQGRAALFLDTGLGKTLDELAWARAVARHTDRPVLVYTPLAVAGQMAREAVRFDLDGVRVVREQDDVRPGVNIANYERHDRLDPRAFGGVALDESSILKAFAGKTTRRLIRDFRGCPFKLSASATPSPNDHTELGQHSEFLEVMPSSEMLSRWFVTDQAAMGRYRLKGHAAADFWRWVASWARAASRPSDLGAYPDDGFVLPELREALHHVRAETAAGRDGLLFHLPGTSATEIHAEKRAAAPRCAGVAAELVAAESGEPWVVWVDTDAEARAVRRAIPEAVEVRGSQSVTEKERRLQAFSDGEIRVLVTKASIAGFGLNWQHCAHTVVVNPGYSYEKYYQLIRRFWRFGQTRPVNAHIVLSESCRAAWETVKRKAGDHRALQAGMVAAMCEASQAAGLRVDHAAAQPLALPGWLGQRTEDSGQRAEAREAVA